MEQHAVVVVGAGFAGAATAWHLAGMGQGDVVLLEREPVPGFHSSGRNAALVREHVEAAAWQPLTRDGAAFLRGEALAGFRPTGSLLLGLGDTEASDRVPIARGRGRWCPDDGVVDVAALLASYLKGRDVRLGCTLRGFERAPDGLLLHTDHGRFLAGTLVNAAGAWAGRVGGLDLPTTNRHLFVTGRMPDVDPSWPFVWDVGHGLYFRPESGGLLLSPCDETAAEPGDYRQEEEQLVRLGELVRDHQPGLGDPSIAYRWVGQRTFAPDRLPVIGFDPREPRLFHVAGLGGHGVTSSWAVGRLAATALLRGGSDPGPYDPLRAVRREGPPAAPPAG